MGLRYRRYDTLTSALTSESKINFQSIVLVAIENYEREILLLLLENGANPNLRGISAPLEHACAAFKGESYWFEIIAILIAYGANSDELFVRQFFEQHEVALKGKNSTRVNIF